MENTSDNISQIDPNLSVDALSIVYANEIKGSVFDKEVRALHKEIILLPDGEREIVMAELGNVRKEHFADWLRVVRASRDTEARRVRQGVISLSLRIDRLAQQYLVAKNPRCIPEEDNA